MDDQYLEAIKGMLKCIVVWPSDDLIDKYFAKEKGRQIVFEGAQGLLLDQFRKKYMPYLTRSSTGMRNIFDCLRTVKTNLEMQVYLVSRAYLTRHGDGPLWNECYKPYDKIEEPTNPKNPFQGSMRYGYLNKDWYDSAIKEISELKKKPKCIKSYQVDVAMTCLDHLDSDVILYSKKGHSNFIEGTLPDFQKVKITSYGRTENKVTL